MGEAAVTDDWLISQAVAEYEAYRAGTLRPSVRVLEAPDGELQYCGIPEDKSRWTVSFVRGEDRVVTPLAVGSFEHVCATFRRLDRAQAKIEDRDLFPPPVARLGAGVHQFRATQGRSLVGVAQAGKAALLLCAIGEQLAVVYLENSARVVLDIKPPLGLREVDADRMLGFHQLALPKEGGAAKVQPSSAIAAQHAQIVHGVSVDVGRGPALPEVLEACFLDIQRRAWSRRRTGEKFRGRTKLRPVLEVLLKLCLAGCGDLVGRTGELIAVIKEQVPEFEISNDAFADVLNLMLDTRTCLIARKRNERIWRVRLSGMRDPRSALHAQLCKETAE